MIKRLIARRGKRKAMLLDSISHVDAGDAGCIVVSASHGGASSAEFAMGQALAAVFFNDAGVGKDKAGIAALERLEQSKVPAGTVSHLSARIGDVEDMWEHGVISHVNACGRSKGLKAGERLRDAVERLLDA